MGPFRELSCGCAGVRRTADSRGTGSGDGSRVAGGGASVPAPADRRARAYGSGDGPEPGQGCRDRDCARSHPATDAWQGCSGLGAASRAAGAPPSGSGRGAARLTAPARASTAYAGHGRGLFFEALQQLRDWGVHAVSLRVWGGDEQGWCEGDERRQPERADAGLRLRAARFRLPQAAPPFGPCQPSASMVSGESLPCPRGHAVGDRPSTRSLTRVGAVCLSRSSRRSASRLPDRAPRRSPGRTGRTGAVAHLVTDRLSRTGRPPPSRSPAFPHPFHRTATAPRGHDGDPRGPGARRPSVRTTGSPRGPCAAALVFLRHATPRRHEPPPRGQGSGAGSVRRAAARAGARATEAASMPRTTHPSRITRSCRG